MKVRVQSVNFNVDQDLINFIDSKINNEHHGNNITLDSREGTS